MSSAAEGAQADVRGARAASAARSTERAAGWPPLWLTGVHLAGLWALAFVQPLFDLLGRNAAFFVARDNTPGDVLIFALGFTLVPPLVATGVLALVRLASRPAARVLQLALVAFLAGVFLLQVVKGLSESSKVLFPLGLLLGAGFAALYARSGGVRSLVSLLGIAPVVVLALLLVFSPVKDVVFPPQETTTRAAALPGGAAPRTPVVVLIFDELPTTSLMTKDQRIDARRYPNFARLARGSTWYRNATSVSDG